MIRFALSAAVLGLGWMDAAAAQSYSASVLADSPVAYYRFEETAGTTAADSSGNGNTGTYVNGPLLGQASSPRLGRAVRFDGLDDYVDLARTIGGTFTIEAWVNTSAPSRTGPQAYVGDGIVWSDVGGAANDFILAGLNDHAAFFTGNPDTTVEGTTRITTGAWRHLVATRTQGGTMEVWVDAVLQASGPTNGSVLDANPRIAIGGNVLDSRFFDGLIDEVALYTTALPPARIQAHFLAGGGVPAGTAVQVPATRPWWLAGLVALVALAAFARRRRA